MLLKNRIWYHLFLAFSVVCYSNGLYAWSGFSTEFLNDNFPKAVGQGFLIAMAYFAIKDRNFVTANWLHRIHFLAPLALYLEAYQSVLPYLWFWSLLFVQLILVVCYEWGIAWRKIPVLKNLLIAAMWFVQLNLIPALDGASNLLYFPFFLFYLALSIQGDIEDIAEDAGQIKTLASLLGKQNASYLVIFLLTSFSFLLGLPWVWIMVVLIVIQREFKVPKGGYDSLLFLLGLYFLLR
jgi:hypothetical protein